MATLQGGRPLLPPRARTATRSFPAAAFGSWQEAAWLGLALLGVHLTSAYSYLLFHGLVELFAICIASAVFIIAVNGWSTIRDPYVRFIGIAYLFVAGLDFLHLLSYKGMRVFPDYDYYAPQFWIAARYLEAMCMLIGFAFVGRRPRLRAGLVFGALALATATLVASILVFHTFPACFVPGHGLTAFKVVSEYVICGILIASLLLLHRNQRHFDPRVHRLVGWSLMLMIAMELCFTLYVSDDMNDAINELGHLIKVVAFYCIYKALVVTGVRDPLNALFRELKASETRLAEAQRLARLGTWEWDLRADRWSWSDEISRFVAPRTDAVPGLQVLVQALVPRDGAALAAALARCRNDGEPFELLLNVDPRGRDERIGHLRARAVRGADGAVARLQGTLQDVTDAQRALGVKELAREKERFEALLQTSGDGIHVFDLDGNVLEVNDKFCRMLGYTRAEAIGMNVAQWDAHFDKAALHARLAEIRRRDLVFETRHRRKDGSVFDVEISAKAVEIGGRLCLWNASRDISERKRTEVHLMMAASVFTHASEGILITDADANIVEVNDAFVRITGWPREEALGRNPRMLHSGLQPPEFYDAMWRTLAEQGQWAGELQNRRRNGEIYTEWLNISAVRDVDGKVRNFVGMLTDVTQVKEHERRLERMAHFDALTGLPNRVLATDRLLQAMLQAQRRGNAVAVAFLDIDGFKAVNDRHGHDVGDACLVAVAKAMRDSLREGDTLARLGGDEFLAVLGDLGRFEDCEPILRRLLRAASLPVIAGEHVLKLSTSIGVTLYPRDGGTDPDQLIRHADQAMYVAKQNGKNRYHVFDVEQDAAIRVQRESTERIRAALEAREFVLHYQPKVNMRTGAVIGAEALIRWQHPERGLLPPAEFLPVIAEHPVSVELGAWVIDTALEQVGRWHRDGLDLPVSVNVGAAQLLDGHFPDRLDRLLARHPLVRPSQLELEILETSALENLTRVSELMRSCTALGVRFALDDFGTGYSSLSYLKHLPVDIIKIDQSFVRDILTDPGDLALVKGIIGLAKAFDRRAIAEGVETPAHGALLLSLGCELGQGYGIARPMAAESLPGWAGSWRPDPTWRASLIQAP